ncbi:hypothetical protein D3C81_2314960 [compost metagenome]
MYSTSARCTASASADSSASRFAAFARPAHPNATPLTAASTEVTAVIIVMSIIYTFFRGK